MGGKRLTAVLVLAAAAGGAVGCGEEGPEPKRLVEARTEALRYFGPDTPFVAVADPSPGGVSDPAATFEDLAAIDSVAAFAGEDLRFVERQGIAVEDLVAVLSVPDPTLEIESAQVAVGVTPTQTPVSDVLIAIVTARPEATRVAAEEIVRETGLRPAGTIDKADIYSGEHATISVRDGVILIANSPAQIEGAIERRDADPGERIDEGRIDDALEPVSEAAALIAFLDIGELVRLDPALGALVTGDPLGWLRGLGDAGVSIVPGQPAQIRFNSELDSEQAEAVPLEEAPRTFDLSEEDLEQATSGPGSNTSGFRAALIAIGPGALTVSSAPDELRALVHPDG